MFWPQKSLKNSFIKKQVRRQKTWILLAITEAYQCWEVEGIKSAGSWGRPCSRPSSGWRSSSVLAHYISSLYILLGTGTNTLKPSKSISCVQVCPKPQSQPELIRVGDLTEVTNGTFWGRKGRKKQLQHVFVNIFFYFRW